MPDVFNRSKDFSLRFSQVIDFFCFGHNEVGYVKCFAHVGKPRLDDLAGFLFDLLEIEFNIFLGDGSDFGKRYPIFFFLFNGIVVHRDPAVKAFELDRLGGSIGGDTDKLSRGEAADLAGRHCRVELLALAGAAVASVGADGVLFLQYSPESLRDQSG